MDTSQGKGGFKSMEKRVLGGRPHKDRVLNCPRCNSSNTKFCYYNNYSLSQPRYFCKACRRYWTEGGTLRNVPVGGGSRKNKCPHSSSSSCTSLSSTSTYLPCSSKTVSVPINVGQIGASGHLSSRNPSVSLQDLALAGHFLLPGAALPTEKFFEPGRNRDLPNSSMEMGDSSIGLALGSCPLTISPDFMTTSAAADHPVEPLVFPFDFPLESGIRSMQRAAGIDTRELVELQGGGGDKLQMQGGDQSHQGFWGGFFGAGPW